MNLGYLKRIAGGFDRDVVAACVDECSKRSGMSKAEVYADMLRCVPLYGAGWHDYMLFEFYNLNAKQRATYMTRIKNRKMTSFLNPDESLVDLIDNKCTFNEIYDEFLGRDWRDLSRASDAELEDFVTGKEYIFAKPAEGESGKGIEKLRISDFNGPHDVVVYLRRADKRFELIEDVLEQHEELNRLYPHSVNCLRMVTIVWDAVPRIIYAVLKTGNHGKFVDNLENGGYACHMDVETGVVVGPGHTNTMDLVEEHPATGVEFVGFKVPYYKEVCDMLKKAAMVTPDVRYIGWDVCVTPTGPVIIEANPYTGYDFPQLPDYSQPKEGYISMIRKAGVPIKL